MLSIYINIKKKYEFVFNYCLYLKKNKINNIYLKKKL